MRRHSFLAGVAAVAVSSKLPPLPAVPVAGAATIPSGSGLLILPDALTTPGDSYWSTPLDHAWPPDAIPVRGRTPE